VYLSVRHRDISQRRLVVLPARNIYLGRELVFVESEIVAAIRHLELLRYVILEHPQLLTDERKVLFCLFDETARRFRQTVGIACLVKVAACSIGAAEHLLPLSS
jgi:hypothetical protein